MIPLQVTIEASKASFFDRAVVLRAIGRERARALAGAGAFVMTRARTSLRKPRRLRVSEWDHEDEVRFQIGRKEARKAGRKLPKRPWATSRPGEPPRTPTGTLRRTILFSYDRVTDSVVIGPRRLNRPTGAPATLEYGGTAPMLRGRRIGQQVRVEPRPFMRPALEAEITAGTIPQQFRHLIRS